MIDVQQPCAALPKRGRPRRGTEIARTTALINAATRVFLREGYGLASIDKVAAEAGVSTRTIYERYKNKADLLGAAIGRLVDRMSKVLSTLDLNDLEPKAALAVIAEIMTDRARDPDAVALFRIVATEAHRFPELAAKMRENNKLCVDNVVVNYLRDQASRGVLNLADPDRAATLFRQMICSELHDRLLFGGEAEVATLDFKSHVDHVIDLFLLGAAPRK
jgi:AcrR family transcriptional regulator